jgi:hypothetical protein
MKQRVIQVILLLAVVLCPFSNGFVEMGEAKTTVTGQACVLTGLPSTSPMFSTPKDFYHWLSANRVMPRVCLRAGDRVF